MAIDVQAIPRAPGWLPLLGHAFPLWRRPIPFLKSLKNTGDLVRIDLGTLPVCFVTTSELTQELLVTNGRNFDKGRFFDRARVLLGEGLVTSNGELHRRHRRLMQPMFHQARIAGYADIMGNQARSMIDSWKPGETFAVDKALYEFSVATLVETLFSTKITPGDAENLRRDVLTILKYALIRAMLPSFLDRLPIPVNRRFNAASARLRRVIDDVIAVAHRTADAEDVDLVSTLIAARDADSGEALSDKEVYDEIVTIMVAGSETTASTLAWAFHELARHPDVEERLLAEVDSVVGTRPVGFHDVVKLDYTDRVLKEVARLHALPLIMRRANAPVKLGGVDIPRGTEVAFSLYALHQDSRLYPDPERFDPDRWLPGNRKEQPREAYIPFGLGNRKCIGDAFATTESIITLATVAARFRLRPVASVEPVREVTAAVAYPNHLPMKATPRET